MIRIYFFAIYKYSLLSVTVIFLLIFSCSGSSSNQQSVSSDLEDKSEITSILFLFKNSIPEDGEWDDEQSGYGSPIIYNIEYTEVGNDNKMFYCYDTQTLLKIEILGYLKNASIQFFQNDTNEPINFLKNTDITDQFVISSNNLHSNGKLVIKSGNKVIREVEIQYEGCL